MSKLNVMVAILKFINGRNDSPDSLRKVCDYITDKDKTKHGMLVATHGCSTEHPVDDMLANKRLHNKTHGKQYEHFVLAPCPNGSDKSPEAVLKATEEIVSTLFPENMAIISVHTDSNAVHSHTVLDAVNAVTGRKFSQNSYDLNRVKQKANNILKKHGFEIITASANDFVDYSDHSNEEGFDFLELDESELITETDINEITACTDTVSVYDYLTLARIWCGSDSYSANNYGGNKTMRSNDSYTPCVQQTQEISVPTSTVSAVPTTAETPENCYPNTTVVTGPTFRIGGNENSNFAGLGELVKQTTAYAQEHQREAANLALAMQQYGQQSGYPSNVSVYAGPVFDIDLTGGYQPLPGYDKNKY